MDMKAKMKSLEEAFEKAGVNKMIEQNVKMKDLLLEARYLLTAPHRTEELDKWLDDLKQVISNKQGVD